MPTDTNTRRAAPLAATDVLTVRAGRKTLLDELTISFATGEINAVLGPNGAGKSTLLRALLGLDRHDKALKTTGRALLSDEDVAMLSAHDIAVRCAYLPARDSLAFDFSVEQVVCLGRYVRHRGAPTAIDRKRVAETLTDLGIAHLSTRRYFELSTGEKAKVGLARCIVADTPLLLLDEPTGNLDVGSLLSFHAVLKRLRSEGRTIILTTHDLNEACLLADRVFLLREGGLLASGKTSDVLTPDMIQLCFGVEAKLIGYQGGETLVFTLPD